jgi:ParB-like chromosome segregation protein Spo0J
MAKLVTLKLDELKETFFVRKSLDDDRVLYLAEQYENGVALPPIEVTEETHEIIDGRHRRAALSLLGRTETVCQVVSQASRAQLIVTAFIRNSGGSLPPTREDTEHTIELLLDQGVSGKQIAEALPLPPSLAKKYLTNVRSMVLARNKRRAVLAVTDGGLTIAEAADKFHVDAEVLREEIRGKRKESKLINMAALKGGIQSRFKGASLRNMNIVRQMLDRYEDGVATEEQVLDILNTIDHSIQRMRRSHMDWFKRFEETRTKGSGATTA